MNANFWSLLYGGTEKSFADWGIAQDCSRQRLSLATDKFNFSVLNLAVDAALPFAANQTAIIKRNGVNFFYGRVTKLIRTARPGAETIRYELSGPWWYLEVIPFLQNWNIATDPTNKASAVSPDGRSRVIMFQDIAGARTTPAQMISEIVGYAQGKGAPIVLGGVSLSSLTPPFSEIRDQMCAEVIRSALRWNPDAVGWFDYAPATPVLYVERRSALPSFSFPAFNSPAAEVSITPRNDLVCAGVLIIYESTNSLNELTWTTVVKDQVGAIGIQGAATTVELSGSSKTVQTQELTILGVDVTSRAFWESLLPWLHQATSVTIGNVRVNNALASGQSADASDATSGYTGLGLTDFSGAVAAPPSTSNLLNVLANGQVPSWLTSRFFDAVITAKISYTLENPDTHAKEVKEKVPFTAKCKATDLNNGPLPQSFSQLIASTPAETIPSGVAAAYYAAASVLHYEGEFSTIEDEVSGTHGIGEKINLTGAAAEWATMDALIQSVDEQLGTGQTTWRFGPPAHLAVADFIEIQRVQRGRSPTYRLAERVTGVSYGNGAQVQGAFQVTQSNSSPSHQPGKTIVLGTTDPTKPGTIKVSVDDIVAAIHSLTDKDIKLREVDGCTTIDCSGTPTIVACKYVGLLSAPYNIATCP